MSRSSACKPPKRISSGTSSEKSRARQNQEDETVIQQALDFREESEALFALLDPLAGSMIGSGKRSSKSGLPMM